LDKLVYISLNGEAILINPRLQKTTSFDELKGVYERFQDILKFNRDKAAAGKDKRDNIKQETAVEDSGKTPFELECETSPGPIKDHMAYWPLIYLKKLKVKADAGQV
jgi:hypothetical protein